MPLPKNAPNLIAFLKSLRAVRQFQKQEVPQDVLTAILDVARWSGSASNRQPWELIIVRDREMLQALAAVEGYVGHLAGAAVAIVLVMAGDAGQVEQETFDEGRLSERIMLAAAAYSVGASIGWFWGNGRSQVKHLLGIPQGRLVRTAISLGYPDREAMHHRPRPAQARKPLLQIVHWERYGNK